MRIVAETIELQTHSTHKVLRFSNVEKSRSGEEYACQLFVRSGDYSCARPFDFDNRYLQDTIIRLKQMDEGTPCSAMLKSPWEDDCLRFESNDMGHVQVSGELYERSDHSQSLKFSFRTDQTVLGPLIADLETISQV